MLAQQRISDPVEQCTSSSTLQIKEYNTSKAGNIENEGRCTADADEVTVSSTSASTEEGAATPTSVTKLTINFCNKDDSPDKEVPEAANSFYMDTSTTCSLSEKSSASFSAPVKYGSERENAVEKQNSDDGAIWTQISPDAKWKVRTLGLLAALLPGFGCYFCLAYTYLLQYDNVSNFTIPSSFCPGQKSMFPPVSYSIGVWKPQKYIWLMILSLHLPPRFFYAIVHKNHYSMGESEFRNRRWFSEIVRLHYILLVAEALGLLSVSVIDIESHFRIHATCFASWLIPFNFNMLFNCLLHYHSGIRKLRPMHDIVFQIKCFLFLVGYLLSVSTAISYSTFVLSCSTTAYAAFSMAEYVIVGINSIFYFLIVWEFDGSKVEVYIKHKHRHHQNAIDRSE